MHLQLLQLTCKCGHLHLRRRGRKSGRQGGAAAPSASQAQSLPLTSNQGPCLPASLQLTQLRASWPPLTPLGLFCRQHSVRKAGGLSPPSLSSELPTQQGMPGQAASFTDHFWPSFSFISGLSFLNASQTDFARFVGLVF